jgi:hypothetical protein
MRWLTIKKQYCPPVKQDKTPAAVSLDHCCLPDAAPIFAQKVSDDGR